MNDEKRKELIKRCRGFASKNSFCLNLAALYIFLVILTYNIYKHFKKALIYGIAALVAAIVLICVVMKVREQKQSKNEYIQDVKAESEWSAFVDGAVEETGIEAEQKSEADKEENTDSDDIDSNSDIKADDPNIILVNKLNPIPDDYKIEIVSVMRTFKCNARAKEALEKMFSDAQAQGIDLVIRSAYRDSDRQEELFAKKIKRNMSYGYSYIEAYKKVATENTIPGTSEHEIGMAFDIISDDYERLDEGFEATEASRWLMDNSFKYGFILRYPRNKESITGIIYEPWHYRYVGVDAATAIYKERITLEEYMQGR